MVIGAFPVVKLAAILLKQVSKPIANAVKEQAKSSPFFRHYVCMPPAQFYNWCEVKAKMWVLNLGKPVNIPVLNEAMAIELGANLLGEGIIFLIASAALLVEYARSSRKEAAKEDARKNEIEFLQNEVKDLFFVTQQQQTQLRELLRIAYESGSPLVKQPPDSDTPEEPPVAVTSQEPPDSETPQKPPDSGTPQEPPPPQPPSPPSVLPSTSDSDLKIKSDDDCLHHKRTGLVSKAINSLENELWQSDEPRELGVLSEAINYIYKEVYRVPLSMS